MGKQHTLSTKSSRHLPIEHQGNCWSDAVTKEGASTATPHALQQYTTCHIDTSHDERQKLNMCSLDPHRILKVKLSYTNTGNVCTVCYVVQKESSCTH